MSGTGGGTQRLSIGSGHPAAWSHFLATTCPARATSSAVTRSDRPHCLRRCRTRSKRRPRPLLRSSQLPRPPARRSVGRHTSQPLAEGLPVCSFVLISGLADQVDRGVATNLRPPDQARQAMEETRAAQNLRALHKEACSAVHRASTRPFVCVGEAVVEKLRRECDEAGLPKVQFDVRHVPSMSSITLCLPRPHLPPQHTRCLPP